MEYTSGPWKAEKPPHKEGFSSTLLERHPDAIHIVSYGTAWGFGVSIAALSNTEEGKANAALIAAAPDYALLLAALISGKARWEQLGNGPRGELCVSGLRHLLEIDVFGCPVLTDQARAALI